MNFWDFFWLMVWSFFIICYLMVLFQILLDVIRDDELSGLGKAGWVIRTDLQGQGASRFRRHHHRGVRRVEGEGTRLIGGRWAYPHAPVSAALWVRRTFVSRRFGAAAASQ